MIMLGSRAGEYSPRLIRKSACRDVKVQVNEPMASGVANEIPKRWPSPSAVISPIAAFIIAWSLGVGAWSVFKSVVFGFPLNVFLHARLPNLESDFGFENWTKPSPMLLNVDVSSGGEVGWVKKTLLSCGQSAKCCFRHNELLSFCLVALDRLNLCRVLRLSQSSAGIAM